METDLKTLNERLQKAKDAHRKTQVELAKDCVAGKIEKDVVISLCRKKLNYVRQVERDIKSKGGSVASYPF